MTTRVIDVRGKKVEITEAGSGDPVLYLHDMWDIHTAQAGMFPFHEKLAANTRFMAPAHPGCGQSTAINEICDIEDLAFHYFDVLDALQVEKATIVGVGLGGWIATEMAVRDPNRIGRMALIGAAGLQKSDALIADIFMYSQHRDGGIMRELREILFADPESSIANEIVPNGRVSVADEVRRYKSLTLAGRVGWEPPYLHDKKLLGRLRRINCETLLIWGELDRFVPLANGRSYAESIQGARLVVVPGAGHSVTIEKPDECLTLLAQFLKIETLASA